MKNVAKNEIVLHDPYSNALWGGRRLMANAILNFHFDYWHTSLTCWRLHSKDMSCDQIAEIPSRFDRSSACVVLWDSFKPHFIANLIVV